MGALVAHLRKEWNAYKFLDGTPDGKRPLARHERRWEGREFDRVCVK